MLFNSLLLAISLKLFVKFMSNLLVKIGLKQILYQFFFQCRTVLIFRNHIWADFKKRGGANTGDQARARLLTCQSTHTFTDPPPERNKTPKITSIRIYNGRVTGIFLVQCAPSVPSYATAFFVKNNQSIILQYEI